MKRIIIMLMAVIMVFSLSACKSSNTTSSDVATEADGSQTTSNNDELKEDSIADSSSSENEVVPDTGTVPHAAVTEGTVVDAVTYSKDVVAAKGEDAKDYENQKHVIALPKISKDSANAKAFNEKIYNNSSKIYQELQSNKENREIYNIAYEYKEYKDIVGIMVMKNISSQGGETKFSYETYYYNLNKDCELTYEQYLKALGLTKEKIDSVTKETREYGEMLNMSSDKEKVYVKECLTDDNGTIIFVNNPNEENGWWRIDIGSIL